MHSAGLVSCLLLVAASLAAPVKQHPLGSHKTSPFTKDHRDPYDRKVDSVGKKLQPEPYVRIVLVAALASFSKTCTDYRSSVTEMARVFWGHAIEPVKGRILTSCDHQVLITVPFQTCDGEPDPLRICFTFKANIIRI